MVSCAREDTGRTEASHESRGKGTTGPIVSTNPAADFWGGTLTPVVRTHGRKASGFRGEGRGNASLRRISPRARGEP